MGGPYYQHTTFTPASAHVIAAATNVTPTAMPVIPSHTHVIPALSPVIPAKAGIQCKGRAFPKPFWTPAFAGVTA